MNKNPIDTVGREMRRPSSVRFGIFMGVVFGGHAVGMAIFVGLVGLILSIPARSLLLPYTTLLYCGLVLSPLLYWAWRAWERPKSCALRFGIAMFFYLQAVMLALALSAIKLGILSQAEAVSDFGLLIVPLSAFTFVASYIVVRQMASS